VEDKVKDLKDEEVQIVGLIVANSCSIVPGPILPMDFECPRPSQQASQTVSSRTRIEVLAISQPETAVLGEFKW
jgi:hypothetical protein